MTKQEVEEGNKQIELYNKFCFTKKPLPKYKKIVPLRVAIMYYIISCVFLSLPTIFSVNPPCMCFSSPEKCRSDADKTTREYRVKLLNEILKDVDKL